MRSRLLPRFERGSIRPYIIVVLVFFTLNIIFTGILRNKIRQVNTQIYTVEAQYYANHTRHANLYSQRQDLLRRDRIIGYAEQRLGMELLRPDEIASGEIIKEVREDEYRHSPVYAFVDFLTPSANVFERAR